jgi:hypothetical protein
MRLQLIEQLRIPFVHNPSRYLSIYGLFFVVVSFRHVKWVPVPIAWRVLGLRMEERPPAMEGSCEYIE